MIVREDLNSYVICSLYRIIRAEYTIIALYSLKKFIILSYSTERILALSCIGIETIAV